jgi:uncharacterized protein YciI
MKTSILTFFIFSSLVIYSCSDTKKEEVRVAKFKSENLKAAKEDSVKENEFAYDAKLAKELGADDYGMKTYIMAFLKAGPNRSQDSAEAAALQKAHLNNINRMAEEGTLVLAGPFLDNIELRGIYLFDVATVEEAEELTKTDPMIEQGRLIFEFHPWYGAAVLPLVNNWYKKVTKTEF